jgi:hypothetical protein
MDRRERYDNLINAVNALIHQDRVEMWTALPGIVQSYDATKNTVSVQPSIKAQVRVQNGPNADENWTDVVLPLLVDCPVFFPGGGGFVMTFPLAQGDEGGIIFSSRCIDAWWQSGGVQKQADIRLHDLSDGMFIPKLFSVPNVPANISTTDVQLRDATAQVVIGVTPARRIYLTAPGGVDITGNLRVSGSVIAGNGGADQVSLQSHTHGGVQSGGSQTSAPTPGT